MAGRAMFRRRVLDRALEGMRSFPVVMLQGPRTVGKTTLLEEIAARFGGAVVDLDHPGTRLKVRSDPDSAVAGPGPVFIDEYQKMPEILDYIKARLNVDGSPGRFVLTGSSRHEALSRGVQALTGRLLRLPVLPLSQAEIAGAEGGFIERMFNRPEEVGSSGGGRAGREDYVERVLAGGFPMQVNSRDARERRGMIEQYLRLSIEVDARELLRVHRPEALSYFLQRLAAQTGQILNMAKAGGDAGVKAGAAENYTRLLEAVFILRRLPAWRKTARGPVRRPKIYVLDSGVAAHLLGFTAERLRSNAPSAAEQFGHLLETLAVGEIWKMVSWLDDGPMYKVGYWKHRSGAEVDLVIERPEDGAAAAFEVKAARQVRPDDAKGLRLLRDELGKRFRAGAVLYTGRETYRLADGLYAMPVDEMWRGEAVGRPRPEQPRPGRSGRGRGMAGAAGWRRDAGETAAGDALPPPVRAAADRMLEMLNPGESAYWEIAVTPSEPVQFDDFYSSEGVRGALMELQTRYPGRRVYGLGYQGAVQTIDECAALTDAGRGMLVHPAGAVAAVALGMDAEFRDFLGWPSGPEDDRYLIARHAVLNQWPLEVALFAHEQLRPCLGNGRLTFWSAGRRLLTGRPAVLLGDEQGSPPSLTQAVVDNPYRKQIPSAGDPEVDAYNLKASFYEWFGIPASGLPEAARGRIALC